MHEVRIPTLGESITEGVIVRWLIKDGDEVAVDAPILELETDKASVEIPAPVAGVIRVDRAEGDTVQVGDTVARIDPSDAAKGPTQERTQDRPDHRAADGGAQSADAAASQTAADAAASGTPRGTVPTESAARPAVTAPNHGVARSNAPASLSPAVRRIVEENDLDPGVIEGSGRSGRITKADVLRHLNDREGTPAQPATALRSAPETVRTPRAPTPYPNPDRAPSSAGDDDAVRTPLTRLRRRIAERLLEAQRSAAILTTFNEVDMSAVLALRQRFKKDFEDRHGTRLGFMSFFARACIAAIADVPLLNARIDGEDVVQPNSVNLAIAVGTTRGLVVPVLHGADKMSFPEIESNVARLAALAQENKLSIADLSGGTFTISNGGVYGSLLSTPILNPPQSGILGMHKIEKRAVVVDDEIVIRPMMYLALSYDHRLIDGSDAVTFLVRVKERIEAPERLLLEV